MLAGKMSLYQVVLWEQWASPGGDGGRTYQYLLGSFSLSMICFFVMVM